MKVLKSEQLICFDVDDTLVSWSQAKRGEKMVTITCPLNGQQHYLVVHQAHVKILKDRFKRGALILVWSQGGWAWAEAVIKALHLEAYVHYVASKPIAYLDDKPCEAWMGERIYLELGSNYGKF